MDGWSIAAVAVAVVAVFVAFWQGSISKQQLNLARETEGETKRTLDQIKAETAETRRISQDIKNNIDERITKILDNKLAAEQQAQTSNAAISQALMQKMMEGMGMPGTPPPAK